MRKKTESGPVRRLDAGVIAQAAALAAAVVSSACCWLPLLLIAMGVSGGALAAAFEAGRPALLPATFALLGVAFYFTYRRPRGTELNLGNGDCCAVPEPGDPGASVQAGACCPDKAEGLTLRKANKAILWAVTVLVLAFAFFPNYVGWLLRRGNDAATARTDLEKVVVRIEGMTCEACAANIERSLQKVPGVAAAKVTYAAAQAVVGFPRGTAPPREAILAAIAGAGSYKGIFAEPIEWSLAVEGMTCEGCATTLESALAKIPGVVNAAVIFGDGRARVAADPTVTEGDLRTAVSAAGYSLKAAERR